MSRLTIPRSKEELDTMVSSIMGHMVEETPYGNLLSQKVDLLTSGAYGSLEHMLQIAHFPTQSQKLIIDMAINEKLLPHQIEARTDLTRSYCLSTLRVARKLGIKVPDFNPRDDMRMKRKLLQKKGRSVVPAPVFTGSKGIPQRIREHMNGTMGQQIVHQPVMPAPLPLPKPVQVVEERKKPEQTMEVKLRVTQSQLKRIMEILES